MLLLPCYSYPRVRARSRAGCGPSKNKNQSKPPVIPTSPTTSSAIPSAPTSRSGAQRGLLSATPPASSASPRAFPAQRLHFVALSISPLPLALWPLWPDSKPGSFHVSCSSWFPTHLFSPIWLSAHFPSTPTVPWVNHHCTPTSLDQGASNSTK